MNLSGIAVSMSPQDYAETVTRIEGLSGVEVHYRDPAGARVVLVQEAETVDAEVEGLKQIKAIPGVVVAELVYHYFADDPNLDDPASTWMTRPPPNSMKQAASVTPFCNVSTLLQRLNPN